MGPRFDVNIPWGIGWMDISNVQPKNMKKQKGLSLLSVGIVLLPFYRLKLLS